MSANSVKERLIIFIEGMSMALLDMKLDRSTLEYMTVTDLEAMAQQLEHIYYND